MPLTKLEQVLTQFRAQGTAKKLAVASAADEHTLEAVFLARKEGVVNPILFGNKEDIKRILDNMGESIPDTSIVHSPDAIKCAQEAVQTVRDGGADFLMKGMVETSDILRAVIDKENGLLSEGVISMFSFMELPEYHKLLVTTDGAINREPDLEKKKGIILNAVKTLHKFGYSKPKVAVLTAVEKVNPKMPETVDASALAEMSRSGELPGCIVEGPISMDIALSAEVAKHKGYESQVAGDPDILVWPSVLVGNITGKALRALAGGKTIVLTVGAKAPLVITSRGDSVQSKFNSLVATAATC